MTNAQGTQTVFLVWYICLTIADSDFNLIIELQYVQTPCTNSIRIERYCIGCDVLGYVSIKMRSAFLCEDVMAGLNTGSSISENRC